MPLNDVYQVRHKQTFLTGGKPLESVYFFLHTAGTGVAADLANDFGTVYVPAINALQADAVKNVSINVINLGDLGDFAEPALSGAGDRAIQSLPPYAAYGFTMKVNTRAVRKGSKRISGVPEDYGADGVITDAGYLDLIEDFRVILMTELVSAGDTWLPIVVKRVKTAVAGTTPTQYSYRLPTTDAELVYGEVVVALTTNKLSHQVSREV